MKKLLIGILFLLCIIHGSFGATVTIGSGKSYPWDPAYFTTITNLQNTNITTSTSTDGYLMLAYGSSKKATEIWDHTTGWTTSGTTISTDGDILTLTEAHTGYTYIYDLDFIGAGNDWTWVTKIKVTSYSTTTEAGTASRAGYETIIADGSNNAQVQVRSDGVNIDLYAKDNTAGGAWVKQDTTAAADITRYHSYEIRRVGGSTSFEVYWDGVLLLSACKQWNTENAGICQLLQGRVATDPANVTTLVDFNTLYASDEPYVQAIGTIESHDDSAVFDAGAGNVWTNLAWTNTAANSTAIVYQVKCATTTAGLSSAVYETIAASGNTIVTQKRYIQVKVELVGAGSGRWTPILQDITLTSAAAVTVSGPFSPVGGKGFGARR